MFLFFSFLFFYAQGPLFGIGAAWCLAAQPAEPQADQHRDAQAQCGQVVKVNLHGTFNVNKVLLKGMVSQGYGRANGAAGPMR